MDDEDEIIEEVKNSRHNTCNFSLNNLFFRF